MAKKIIAFTLLAMVSAMGFLSAEMVKADVYPKAMHITRVYPHKLGYRVDYLKSNRTVDTFYAPMEWFKKAAGYGEIVYGDDAEYPYAVFYYKDGKIDHFRLYLKESFNDMTWGNLRDDSQYNDKFGAEELTIKYD